MTFLDEFLMDFFFFFELVSCVSRRLPLAGFDIAYFKVCRDSVYRDFIFVPAYYA